MEWGDIRNVLGTLLLGIISTFLYNQSGILWRWSAKAQAKSNAKAYREMLRRMGNTGEMIAYTAQRITVAIMGLLTVSLFHFLTANDPPIFALIGNFAGFMTAGFLIIYTGNELIRLSDFEAWKADRVAAIRKHLRRTGLNGPDLDAEIDRLTKP